MTSLVSKQEGLSALKLSIWDQANQFLRRLLNIFDMQKLQKMDIKPLLDIIDGLKFLFVEKSEEVKDLTRDLKVLILNAEQKKFCEKLKVSMEKETWTASKFGNDLNIRSGH